MEAKKLLSRWVSAVLLTFVLRNDFSCNTFTRQSCMTRAPTVLVRVTRLPAPGFSAANRSFNNEVAVFH